MRTKSRARRGAASRSVPVSTGLLPIALAAVLISACGGTPVTPSPSSSLSVGQWSGTTAQGGAVTFTVSPEETLTTLAVEYNFNGCSGSQTFTNLNIPTAPSVTCVPGPCSGSVSSYRAFAHSTGTPGAGPSMAINGLFLPGGRASGLVTFRDYPICGTAAGVEWAATRR